MTSLQALNEVYLDDCEDENDDRVVKLIKELEKLNQLRELVLLGVRSKYMSAISSSINNMQQIEKLFIRGITDEAFIDLDLSSTLPWLQRVKFDGNLKKFPEWTSKLQTLVQLKLTNWNSTVTELYPGTKELPWVDAMKSLHFKDGWFKSLKELHLEGFYYLSDVHIEEGALGSLKKLNLINIPYLTTFPTSIKHLQELEVLYLSFMSHKFLQSISPNEGKEHWIFEQVPYVEIGFQCGW